MVHADVGVCDTIVGQGYTDRSPTAGSRFRQIFFEPLSSHERIGRLRGSLILGINPRGFFTFRNQLSNGFTFECQSLINSKVSITSIYSDGDVEHHSSELMQQVTLQYSVGAYLETYLLYWKLSLETRLFILKQELTKNHHFLLGNVTIDLETLQ